MSKSGAINCEHRAECPSYTLNFELWRLCTYNTSDAVLCAFDANPARKSNMTWTSYGSSTLKTRGQHSLAPSASPRKRTLFWGLATRSERTGRLLLTDRANPIRIRGDLPDCASGLYTASARSWECGVFHQVTIRLSGPGR